MYKNPILNCDFSDPDVIKVGDTFYMVSSTFNFIPGLPILVSKDLINWKIINYAAQSIPFKKYNIPQHGKGLWAPSIRFYDGKFYIFVATPDDGIFYTAAEDPYGKWSELKCVFSGKGYEDPCPFWDDDGRLYVVHAFVKSRIGFNSKLAVFEIDPKTFNLIGEDKIVFDGTVTQPTIEGPKFYKRNDWYYIFAPAGGVENGWQSVLRSKNIYGPYDEKIVLRQGKSKINGPHQGAWVETGDGEDWFIHFQQKGIFGRVVHLQPMYWKDDWPIMGKNGEAISKYQIPKLCNQKQTQKIEGLEWQTFCNKSDEEENDLLLWNSKNVYTKPIYLKKGEYKREINLLQIKTNGCSGIIFVGNQYAAVQIKQKQGGHELSFIVSQGEGDEQRKEIVLFTQKLTNVSQLELILKYKVIKELTSDSKAIVKFIVKDLNKKIIYKSKKIEIEKAHWVGGRYGWF